MQEMIDLKYVTVLDKHKMWWKGAEISSKSMGKGLHKVFNSVVKEQNNALPIYRESGSKVSHFIPEPSNFA